MSTLTLTQRRAIDRSKEVLVRAAEALLDEARVTEIKSNDFGHSQLRNLIAVATETESPAVVINFIRYQMGRDSTKKSWSNRAVVEGGSEGGPRLGERFIHEFEKGSVATALAGLGITGDPLAGQLARIELIRQFLGFTSRYLKYLDLQRNGGTAPANGNGDEEGDES